MFTRIRKNHLRIAGALLFAVIATPLWAGHGHGPNRDRPYDKANYDYARVVDVQPVTEIVRTPREQQVCHEEMVRRRVPEYRSPAPAIFGSILGGVIGHQFGGGSGKTAATVAGAAIGGAVATNAQYRRYPPRYHTAPEQRCHIETEWHTEERVIAWDVSWKYRGRVYQSRMDEPPGDRIPVRIRVSPAYE